MSPAPSCEVYDVGDDGDEEPSERPRGEPRESTTTPSQTEPSKKKGELIDCVDKYSVPTTYPVERMTTKDIRSAIYQNDVELRRKRGTSAGPFSWKCATCGTSSPENDRECWICRRATRYSSSSAASSTTATTRRQPVATGGATDDKLSPHDDGEPNNHKGERNDDD